MLRKLLKDHLQYVSCFTCSWKRKPIYLTRPKYAKVINFFLIMIAGYSLTVPAEEFKTKGWALKVMKKAIRFNEKKNKKSFS